MASTTITATAPIGSSAIYHVVAATDLVISRFAHLRKTRATRVSLHSLSDALLNDIGIIRSDIDRNFR